ncbi:MAG: response regulator [Ignavibacteriae bacterium]|nr:response regulator [Ignavibacteria bacterium]MBI3363345.1 response regulator [Ignavibacteriota bacterium]
MKKTLQVLLIEDNEDDAELIVRELERSGYDVSPKRVESAADLNAALDVQAWDFVFCDYTMPHFKGTDALYIIKGKGLDISLIFVSGTMGEDIAVEAMKAGAHDYLVKGNLKRLVPVVQRELREAENRREKKQAENLQDAVYRIAQAATVSRSLEDLYHAVHEIMKEVMVAENFYIALYDEKDDLLSFPYFADEFDEAGPPHKPGKGLTEYVLRSGQSLLCNSTTLQEIIRRGEAERIGAPSPIWLGVPLKIENKTIGVMVVQHYSDENTYGDREKQILEYVSTQVAKAIERKLSEEKLRKSEEQFRLISENVADLIAVLDREGRRIYSSPSYKTVLSDPEQLRGTDSFQEIIPDDRERIRQIFFETVKTGIGQRAEYRFLLKDGSTRQIESQGSVIKDPDGKVTSVIVVSRDITEKKQLEAQFLRAQRMESIGTLAGGIAHDLNNVLAPILLVVEILKRKLSDQQSLQMLDTLERSARRGADMVKQVLTFARGVAGEKMILQPKHLIAEMQKMLKETFPKSIMVHQDVARELWTVSGDATQLHQVLLNLCVNARDAMPDGGMLTLAAENIYIDESFVRMHANATVGPYVILSVTDSGMGMPPEVKERIFEPFFTTKDVGKGTGLGLSTVYSIIKNHGGFIDVYSEVGRGTTFKIYFPALPEAEAREYEQAVAALPTGNGEMILVVDDEASIREITRETLQTYGYRVLSASNGAEAVALYAQRSIEIALVVTDMMMPYMDGMATIIALRKINPAVKVVVSSGFAPESRREEVNRLGVKAFLQKPYTADRLLQTVHDALAA